MKLWLVQLVQANFPVQYMYEQTKQGEKFREYVCYLMEQRTNDHSATKGIQGLSSPNSCIGSD